MRNESQNGKIAKITVGIPTFNGETFLRPCLRSLANQTEQAWIAQITDDASDDATPDICREFAKSDSRYHFHANERRLGAVKNFQSSLALCDTTFFTWLAQDDMLHPRYLESAMKHLEANPTILGVASNLAFIDATNTIIGNTKIAGGTTKHDWMRARGKLFLSPMIDNQFYQYGVFRTSSVRERLLEPYNLPHGSAGWDLVATSRLASLGELHLLSDSLRLYRKHGESDFAKQNENNRSLTVSEKARVYLQRSWTIRRAQIDEIKRTNEPPRSRWLDVMEKLLFDLTSDAQIACDSVGRRVRRLARSN